MIFIPYFGRKVTSALSVSFNRQCFARLSPTAKHLAYFARCSAKSAAKELNELLADLSYKAKAKRAKEIVDSEPGVKAACDAIKKVLIF